MKSIKVILEVFLKAWSWHTQLTLSWKAQAQLRSPGPSLSPLVPKCLFIPGSWEQVGAGLGEALISLGFLWQQLWLLQPVGHCCTWAVELLLQLHGSLGQDLLTRLALALLDKAQFIEPRVLSLVAAASSCRELESCWRGGTEGESW